jgi:predicted GNAT superfamily acetyltransferase
VSDVTIRPFTTIEEYRACVELQEDTWGQGFSERVSPAILKVGQLLGGVSSGAYDADGNLVGFVFGLTGQRNGEVVHWSDMLAVRPEIRDSGLGRRLKAYQREEVLSRGVEKMFWTFDPLQSRNAHLNISRLGAVVREYVCDMYGDTDSPLHHGIGTDRMVALWLLESPRVERRVADMLGQLDGTGSGVRPGLRAGAESEHSGEARVGSWPLALDADLSGPHPTPGRPDIGLGNEAVRVMIPSDIGTLMGDDLPLAVEWRAATRAVFDHYIGRGYEVREFERGTPVSTYLLARMRETEA